MIIDPTDEAISNPQVGDRFHEFFHCWVYVVKVTRSFVWTMQACTPCTFPKDAVLEKRTKKEFRSYYSYKHSKRNKYWITLYDRDNDVEGWVR